MLKSYKNRTIDYTKCVYVYKNLHNGLYSLKQNGKVVANGYNFFLNNVETKINESGRLKVIKNKQKNVHAFIIGYLDNKLNYDFIFKNKISYNPYKDNCFKCNGVDFFKSLLIYVNKEGVFDVSIR